MGDWGNMWVVWLVQAHSWGAELHEDRRHWRILGHICFTQGIVTKHLRAQPPPVQAHGLSRETKASAHRATRRPGGWCGWLWWRLMRRRCRRLRGIRWRRRWRRRADLRILERRIRPLGLEDEDLAPHRIPLREGRKGCRDREVELHLGVRLTIITACVRGTHTS